MSEASKTTKRNAAVRRYDQLKLAFAIWSLEGMGGAERVVYDLTRKLDKTAYNPIIIAFGDGPVRQLFEEIGAKVYALPKKKRFDHGVITGLRKILCKEQVDVVNAHHFGPFLYTHLAATGLRTKMVYTVHSRWTLEHLSFFKKVLNRVMIARAHGVVSISKQIEDYYLRSLKVSKKKVYFISNGIDMGLFRRKNGRLRQRFGIGPNEKVIGIVANLRPEKNHKLLISAISRVTKKMDNIRLVVVGEDCMDGEVQRHAAKSLASDKIYFLGQRDDIPEILSTFDVFCLPSFYEGLPVSILEAMAAGVAVIGSNVDGINEVLKDGENGLLFPSNDEKSLAEAICRLLNDKALRDRLSRSGGLFVAEYYCLDDKVKEYDSLFRLVNQTL